MSVKYNCDICGKEIDTIDDWENDVGLQLRHPFRSLHYHKKCFLDKLPVKS